MDQYTLARDVLSAQRKRNVNAKDFVNHPLLVLNNFSGEGMHIKLMATMFQNMFPSINVNKVILKSCSSSIAHIHKKLMLLQRFKIDF